ncbi:MAG: extracellular solute-binding protein [Defluviitaleaceae bacterium]|nr:extracellular solute-binding protein [Defluviitaleaceae bacterium]
MKTGFLSKHFHRLLKTVVLCVLVASMLPVNAGVTVFAQSYQGQPAYRGELDLDVDFDFLRAGSYVAYRGLHEGATKAVGHTVELDVSNMTSAYPNPEIADYFQGMPGPTILTESIGYVEFTFNIQYEGLYNIHIEYFPTLGRGNDIERRLFINGEIPFNHAAFLNFYRFWAKSEPIRQDSRGNHLRPSLSEVPQWSQAYFSDYLGYVTDPYFFFFPQGQNTIRIESAREPMAIRRLTLRVKEQAPTYADVQAQNTGTPHFDGEPIFVHAVDFTSTNSRMISPQNDRTSPATYPSHPYLVRLNTIGGLPWRFPGQEITWTFTVPETALYQINIKYRQHLASGTFVTRSVRINGETPFRELENVQYSFHSRWQNKPLQTADGEPFLFYLEAGEHTISMEVVLGDWAEILNIASDSVYQLNYAYRQMLLILGPNPDPFRDYQLERFMPDAITVLGYQYNVISDLIDRVIEINDGRRGEGTSILENLRFHLRSMYNDPEAIQNHWVAFRDNISAMGTWILLIREQPLEINYILITAPGADLPRPEAGFFRRMWHEVRALFASFTQDFSLVGDVHEEAIDVWIMSGRDQAQILKNLIDNDFTPNSGIPVNLRLVSGDMVLPAAVTGRGPDVLLGQGLITPVDWALRGAAQSLSAFPGLDEVLLDFHQSAWEPFIHEGELFALPETQNFLMMFARMDILYELNLPVPQTWEQFDIVMSELQRSHMDVHIPFGFPTDINFFLSLLFQQGGEVYRYGGMRSALDSEEGVQALRHWSNFYLLHGAPVFDWDPTNRFVNMFRSGQMPLGFADYTAFNTLAVFAPELRGAWQFFPLPGTWDEENGVLNRSSASGGTAAMMLSASQNQHNAWEFMRWWASADVQTMYGRELESLIGVAARYPTANRQAVENLAWTVDDHAMLTAQWEWTRAFPQVPGGYLTGRHVSNAFRTVVGTLTDPRETLWDFVETINAELVNKRREFGLEYMPLDR